MSHSNITNIGAEIERYERYIQVDPDNSLLWISLADLYTKAGKSHEATACYEKCLLLDPENQVAQSRLAGQWISLGRYREAETALRDLQRNNPGDPVLSYNLGVTLYAQQHWNEALEAFRQAEMAGLEETSNLAYTVHCLHQSGAVGEALKMAHLWLQKSPGTKTEGYIALLEMDHGNMRAARERAKQVLDKEPGNPDACAVLGNWRLEEQQIDTAASHFDTILTSRPDNPRGLLGIALVHLYRQQYNQAVAALEQVLKLSPDHPGVLVTLGWARFISKDIQGAETAFRQAIDANRNFGEAHGGLACALLFQKRNDEAEQAIKRALRLDSLSFGAIFAKSLSLTLQGHKNQGQVMLANLLQQAPHEKGRPLIENIRIFVQQQSPRETGRKPDI